MKHYDSCVHGVLCCVMYLCIGLLVVFLGLLYFYYWNKFKYWVYLGLKTPTPWPVVGTYFPYFFKPMHIVNHENFLKYGRVYGAYEGTRPSLFVTDPKLIKEVLIAKFNSFSDRRLYPPTGDSIFDNNLIIMESTRWKLMRTRLSPVFTVTKLKQLVNLVEEVADRLTTNFMEAADKRKIVECKTLFGTFSMDSISKCAFGVQVNSYKYPFNPFVLHARKLFSRNGSLALLLAAIAPWLVRFFKLKLFPQDVQEFFQNIVRLVMKERAMNKEDKREDFLHLMMEVNRQLRGRYGKNSDPKMEKLSPEVILSQCVLFFLVGYDTTSSCLSFAVYNLAMNQKLQDMLAKEIDDNIQPDTKLTYDVVNEMPLLDAVVKETLRLYPPIVILERTAKEDIFVGEFPVKKGTVITVPIYSLHRDPSLFPDPEKFDPSRFLRNGKKEHVPCSFLPFGTGPRNCIGMNFALLETKVAIIKLMQRIRFDVCDLTKIPPAYYRGLGFLEPKDIYLAISKRG